MRRFLSVPVAVLLVLAMALPALAASPTIISFADDDVADGEFFSDVCGFEIWSESSGHVIFHNDKRGANNFISNWNINYWLSSANGSYHLVDAGPDMEHRQAGAQQFTVTGRSLTGSTLIGRLVIDLDTGEVTLHGQLVGSEPFDLAWICGELD